MNSTVMGDSLMSDNLIDRNPVDSDAGQITVGIESEGDGPDVGTWSGAAAS